jgi:hypothetical protein
MFRTRAADAAIAAWSKLLMISQSASDGFHIRFIFAAHMVNLQRILVIFLCLLIGGKEVVASGFAASKTEVNASVDVHHDHSTSWLLATEAVEEGEETEQDETEHDELCHLAKPYHTFPPCAESFSFQIFHGDIHVLTNVQRFLQLRNLRL